MRLAVIKTDGNEYFFGTVKCSNAIYDPGQRLINRFEGKKRPRL